MAEKRKHTERVGARTDVAEIERYAPKPPPVDGGETAPTGGAAPGGGYQGDIGIEPALTRPLEEDRLRRGAIPGQPGSGDPNVPIGEVPHVVSQAWSQALPQKPLLATGLGGPAAAGPEELAPGPGQPPNDQARGGGWGGGGGGGGGGAPAGEQELWKAGPTVRRLVGEADAARQKALTDAEAGADSENAAQQAALYAAQKDEEARAAAMQKREEQRQAQLRSYQDQFDTLSAEASKMKIDDQRMWHSKSTGQQVAAYIGSALGGFLEGVGRPNSAANMIQEAQDRDIALQKEDYARHQDQMKYVHSLYGMAMQRFGDERAAETATRASQLASTEMQLKRLAVSANTQEKRDRLEILRADLADRRAQLASQMLQYVPAGSGGGGAPQDLSMAGGPELFVQLGDGTGIMARTAMEAEKLRELQGRAAQVVGIIGQLKTLDASASYIDKANPLSTYNRTRGALIAQAQQDLTVLQGQGAMSRGDQEVANAALGGAHRFTNNGAIYDRAAQTVKDGVTNRLVTQGGLRVVEQFVQKGNKLQPRYVPMWLGPRAPQQGQAAPPRGVRVVGQR